MEKKGKFNRLGDIAYPRRLFSQIRNSFRPAVSKKKPVGKERISEHELSEKMDWLMRKQVELEKGSFDDMVAQLIMSWSICVLSIVMLRGLGYLNLSDNVLIALASSPFISTCLALLRREKRG